MNAKYLVDLGTVRIYFDAALKRCAPPVIDFDDTVNAMTFQHVSAAGELLSQAWDKSLTQYTRAQRVRAALYQKLDR
jgi:hypothetical protein